MAVVLGGAILASANAHAQRVEVVAAPDGAPVAANEAAAPKRGFFVGVHSGLISDSGLAPIAAGLQRGTLIETGARSVMASGYYVYTTDWSIGTYVGAGLGALSLSTDLIPSFGTSRTELAYQGLAGVTYQFNQSMTLALEYRYASSTDPLLYGTSPLLNDKEKTEGLSLRFDYLF